MQKIKVVPYTAEWIQLYEDEKKQIEKKMNDNLVKLNHIGSTSVPNLSAKPVIDMLLVVEDITNLDNQNQVFESLGYEIMGEFGIKGRRYYRKGRENRTHQIHAFQYDSVFDIERHLAFRDYLIAYPEIAKQYGDLKSELALKYPKSIGDYGNGKDEFVKKVEKEALIWHWRKRK